MKFRLRRYYLYYLGRAGAFLLSCLPWAVGLFLAEVLGRLAYLSLAKYRKITLGNLASALGGERSKSDIERIARAVFSSLAKNAFEMACFARINGRNIARFVTLRNRERLDEAFRKGRGIVTVTAHCGNWELMAAALRLYGYPGSTIGRRIYFERYDRWLNQIRKLHDVNCVYRDDSPKKMLKVLKSNAILGIVADQDVDSVDGVFVDFFGRPAYTPVGPVVLAKASGASLIPILIMRGMRRHTLIIEKPIDLVDTGDKEKDAVTNTQRWSSVLESYIRKYPEQWVWMHRRWKTKSI